MLLGGIVIALGHLLLGLAPSTAVFFLGLLVIVIGTGLLEAQRHRDRRAAVSRRRRRRDAGFTIYYIGINVGATLGPLIAGLLAARYGWPAGFMTAAVGMTLGVLQYLLGAQAARGCRSGADVARERCHAAPRPRRAPRGAGSALALALLLVLVDAGTGLLPVAPVALQAVSTQAILAITVLYFAYLLFARRARRAPSAGGCSRSAVLFVASVLFWAGYEQTGSSLNLFAERYTDRALYGWQHGSGELVPVRSIRCSSWYSARCSRRSGCCWRAAVSSPRRSLKFILGLLAIAAGFLVMAAAAHLVAAGQLVGMGWLSATYLLHTWGELALSPVGLSAVSQAGAAEVRQPEPRRLVREPIGW